MHKACSVHVSPPLYVRRAYKSSNLIRGGVSRHSFFSYSHQKSENDKKNQILVKYSHFHYIFSSPFSFYLFIFLFGYFFFFYLKLWRFSSRSLTVFFPFEITNTTKELRPPSVRRLFSFLYSTLRGLYVPTWSRWNGSEWRKRLVESERNTQKKKRERGRNEREREREGKRKIYIYKKREDIESIPGYAWRLWSKSEFYQLLSWAPAQRIFMTFLINCCLYWKIDGQDSNWNYNIINRPWNVEW